MTPPADGTPDLGTAGEIASSLGGTIDGDPAVRIRSLATLDDATPADLTFIRDTANAARWPACKAVAALVPRGLDLPPAGPGRTIIRVDDPDRALVKLLRSIAHALDGDPVKGIHPAATVDPTASIHPAASIGPGCVIGARVTIEAHAVLHARVVIQPGCTIGERTIIHPGAVIGADGFGYLPDPTGNGLVKIPHIGAVRIGHDVEIGANTTIDRGKFGDTTIGDGTKIDNLVQIGHNCRIGRSVIICGASAIAGSVTIGDGAVLGGVVGVTDNVTIEPGAQLAGGSLVAGNVGNTEPYIGVPARPRSRFKKDMASMLAVPRLRDRLKALTERVDALTANAKAND